MVVSEQGETNALKLSNCCRRDSALGQMLMTSGTVPSLATSVKS